MTTFLKTALCAGVVAASALVPVLNGTPAEARGGKEFFSKDFQFKEPMHGVQGQQGNYYCSYQRLPNRVCVPTAGGEKCSIKGWTLRQYCY